MADVKLDEHDQAVYQEAFLLAEAVRRFLARANTRTVIAAGLLDDDVVRNLLDAHDRMTVARRDRLAAARPKAGRS